MEALSLELVDNLLIDVINRSKTTRDRSILLSHSEFASDNPEKLAKLIGDICTKLTEHLVFLRNKYESDPVNVLNDIKIIDDFVRDLGANLRYVDGAIATKLPWSLPQPLEELSKKLLPETNLMLRPQWKYNYSILVSDLGQLYRDELNRVLPQTVVEEIFANFPSKFHIVSFPSVERRTALLHCDLGHEIGHLVAKRFLEQEEKTSTHLIDLRRKIAAKLQEDPVPDRPIQDEIQDRLELANDLRWFGLLEIISDIFAMRLLGPAALFALFHMAMADSWDLPPSEETSFYPPWRTRLRHALRALNNSGLLPIGLVETQSVESSEVQKEVQRRVTEIEELAAQEIDGIADSGDWLVKLAYESIDDAINNVEGFLQQEHGDSFLDPKQLYGDVYHLVYRLSQDIPPNAIEESSMNGRPANLETILNAAWFFRIAHLRKLFDKSELDEEFQKGYRILNRLTLKAIEYSHIQKLYQEWDSK